MNLEFDNTRELRKKQGCPKGDLNRMGGLSNYKKRIFYLLILLALKLIGKEILRELYFFS